MPSAGYSRRRLLPLATLDQELPTAATAIGMTVLGSSTNHSDIHRFGNEVAWWERKAINPVATAPVLWISTRCIE